MDPFSIHLMQAATTLVKRKEMLCKCASPYKYCRNVASFEQEYSSWSFYHIYNLCETERVFGLCRKQQENNFLGWH